MFASAVFALARLAGFLIVVACTIVSFYAVIHTINLNTQVNVFFGGLLALLIGIVAGPLYCLIGFHGLHHYLAYSELGAVLIVVPVLMAWGYMVFSFAAGFLRD